MTCFSLFLKLTVKQCFSTPHPLLSRCKRIKLMFLLLNLWGFKFVTKHFSEKKTEKTSILRISLYMLLCWVMENKIAVLPCKRWCRLNIYTNFDYFIVSTSKNVLGLKWCTLCVKSCVYWYVQQWYQFHFYVWTVLISEYDSFLIFFNKQKKTLVSDNF